MPSKALRGATLSSLKVLPKNKPLEMIANNIKAILYPSSTWTSLDCNLTCKVKNPQPPRSQQRKAATKSTRQLVNSKAK